MRFFGRAEPKEFKRWHLAVLIVIVISAVFFRWYYNRWQDTTVVIGDKEFKVLVARTYSQQLQGWSDRADMGGYNGMLFVYPPGTQPAMVMRRMHFSLDILWVGNGQIVDMAPELPPEKLDAREEELIIYRPRLPATLVLEMPAGFVEKYGIKVGDKVVVK